MQTVISQPRLALSREAVDDHMEVQAHYTDFVRLATGDPERKPYDYQDRLAAEGLPELLAVPTGCGKTAAVVLGWLFRRRVHPDEAVRATTPHWLVYALPQRVLVEQTAQEVGTWIGNLDLDIACHVVMGGQRGRTWRGDLDRDAILIGTQDMLLSRALNRGYGDSQWMWPIDFGLLHTGCHWVMDEIQLMGPGLPTTRQLQGLRNVLGTATPATSTWMSATVDKEALRTVDCPEITSWVELSTADRTGPMSHRLDAAKTVRRLDIGGKRYEADLAAAIRSIHRPGRRTLVMLNTVDRARQVWEALSRRGDVPTVLVHSRFRPVDRKQQVDAALAQPGELGTIVVSTQVLEAGVDMTADVLVTEAAPWPSIVQRAGRCNRDGMIDDATLLWVAPPGPAPYTEPDIAAAVEILQELEGTSTTPDQMGARVTSTTRATHAVLRRRDLVELFDTLPDLSGNSVDVTRFVRDADDRTVEVAWRPIGDARPEIASLPAREERCPAPIGEVKKWLGKQTWRFDHVEREWVRCWAADLRPGMVVLADVDAGGYRSANGWSPTSDDPVPPIAVNGLDDRDLNDDPCQRRWVSLAEHSADVATEVERLLRTIDPPALAPEMRHAAIRAGLLHDIGKAHSTFEASLQRFVGPHNRAQAEAAGPPWAKSDSNAPLRHERRHYCHEFASALVLLGDGAVALDGCIEADLVVYLVAAHHGRARLGVRSLPDESPPPTGRSGAAVVLGVADGDTVPAITLGDLTIPSSQLDLSVIQLGTGDDGSRSWSHRMLALRDRDDLGPFRLGFLEALVRLADWRASAAADARADQ
ncbi:MAG: type I-G CRISPR-associated helicase/endonuclease Cas3g [Acidimicrobiales bacterium]